MLPNAPAAPRFTPKPLRKSLDLLVLTALFCALIAATVTLAAPSFARFGRWLLIVECVGLSAVGIGLLLGQLPWLRRHKPVIAHLYISAIAVPAGYVLGSTLAYALLAEPAPVMQDGPRRIIAVIATAIAAVFIVYLDSMRDKVAEEAAARSEAQRLAVESQLRLLRAQLDPHMLFNTLANLRSLIEVDAAMARTMIDQLIVYLRSALAASREESTTLRGEFAQLQAYLEIMSLRMGPRLTYRMDLPEALQRTSIPPMLLQPLVENAIKHGIEPQIGAGLVAIEAHANADSVEIAVTDSGLGLHAFYGPRASLTLTRCEPHGVRATVRIPR
jgi:sensor histidine kinase YesM